MKTAILLISAIIIFVLLNTAIYQKDKIKRHGEVILLKIEPVDPRSLMQGNYMALRYTIEDEINKLNEAELKKHTFAVIQPDKQNVAQFVRLYNGENLSPNEKLIKFRFYPNDSAKVHIKPHSFLFQEDLEPLYRNAAFAIFQYNGNKDYLLTGLADKQSIKISEKMKMSN
ncbi:MAG: GDYXXLXY domain-containing protein [Proteobacteria bacterium]|nr:GDYXXLXY domain-containing protein [Pseudomonadota bacterium]